MVLVNTMSYLELYENDELGVDFYFTILGVSIYVLFVIIAIAWAIL